MPSLNKKQIIEQLNNLLVEFNGGVGTSSYKISSPAAKSGYLMARMKSAIQRYSPPGSSYIAEADTDNEYTVLGVVAALKDDYENDCLVTLQELINADLFSDFLSMAEYLIQAETLVAPAAVIAGSVLEEHLRKLCTKSSIPLYSNGSRPKKTDLINSELTKAGVYSGNDQKQITAWLGVRNSAAHGKYDEFSQVQVETMITGIRGLISAYPA